MSAEPTITCPNCQTDIKLTDTLAAPLLESKKREFDQRLAQHNADVQKREQAMKLREEQLLREKQSVDAAVAEKLKAEREKLAREKESLDASVAEKLKLERAKIASDEAKKARLEMGNDLEQKARELIELHNVLKQRDEKLAEAQQAQAELIRKQRELDDARREMDLTIEKRVQASLLQTREQAKKEAEEHLSLKVVEKDQVILAMQKQIEELKRRSEQGSQQLQGEALELQIESMLGAKFPHDRIEPVPKGEHGGDILQRIITPTGTACGTILWETKRTKNWSDGWLAKLRDDQRAAKAEIAAIVSAALPKDVESFDQIDGVWVMHPRAVIPVAMSLRHMLIEVNCARQASEGQQTKMELIYRYLTGPKFRLRVQAIVEAFTAMQEDLLKEKRAMTKQWSKRDEQIQRVIEATCGMYGELQGIAGQSLQEIEGLDVDLLELPSTTPAGLLA
ncbi:MAG TPA: DUF2130 domain-containing protein [Tepidisphaeraceae bacterium]|jgi:hypothetical protein